MDGAAGGLNGARSSGWPPLEPENQRGQFASPPWQKPSSNFGHRHSACLLVSRGSLQSPFSTSVVYWYGVLPTRVPAPVMMAWFPDTIRNNSAARFAPMFVFIDCVPIALVPLAAWK